MDQPTITYPHDLYRRLKEDEHLPLDERVAKVEETCEKRFSLARKGIFDNKEKERNIVEKQLLENNTELEKLQLLGGALITNIQIACEQRQLEQREREQVFNEDMFDLIQQRSVEIEEKLVNIYKRWDRLKSRLDCDPITFMKTLKVLSKQIQELMKSKDDVIDIVKKDLSRLTASYMDVLDKQDYDLHYCMRRVNNQLTSLKQCYLKHILALDEAINKHHHDEYARIYKCRHEFSTEIVVGIDTSEMLDNLDRKHQAERDHKAALHSKFNELRMQHEEMTHSIRMQLEQDQETIETELEKITATYFLNSLKFNYNYQVLEKKNAENVNKIFYEDKKKNLFKSLNCVTDLKKEIKEMKSMFDAKSQAIAEDTKNFRDRLLKFQVKAHIGAQANESKFQNVLKMNLEEANDLIKKIFNFNEMFFEEHLGIRWEPSDLSILDYSDLEALQKNQQSQSQLSNNTEDVDDDKQNAKRVSIKGIRMGTDDWKTLQLILKKMPAGMNYLTDKDLSGLLELSGMSEKERRLAKLDNIFSALNITSLDDFSTLLAHFQLFTYCPNCEEEKIIDIHKPETNTIANSTQYAENSLFTLNVEKSNNLDNASIDLDLMEHIENLNKIETTSIMKPKKICRNHHMDINYAHIVSALKSTMQSLKEKKFAKVERNEKQNTEVTSSIDLELRKSQIELLWKRYGTIFPDEHLRLWCSLEQGLADYLTQLKKRFQLHSECEHLRKQNAQLKYMLQELL